MKIKTKTISVDEIKLDKEQPRKEFDDEKIKLLAQSIQKQGLINPIEIDEKNKLVTGEMRWRALKKAGIKKTEAKEISDMTEFQRRARQLIENFHRQDLKASECTEIIEKLWKVYTEENKSVHAPITIRDFSEQLGIDDKYCGDLLDLKDASTELKNAIKKEEISVGAAIRVRKAENPKVEKEVLEEIRADKKLGFEPSVARIHEIVKSKNLTSKIKNIDMKELNKPKLSDFLPQFNKVVDKIEFEVGIANNALLGYAQFKQKFNFGKGDVMRLRVSCRMLRKIMEKFSDTLDKIEEAIKDE